MSACSVGIRITVGSLLVDEELEKRITADPLEGRLEAIVGPGQVVEIGVAMVSNGREANPDSGPLMSPDDGFADLMVRICAGDNAAETAVFQRFVHRLIALAASRFETWLRERADVEVVVLSAYKSFFLRNNRGEFDLAGWDELWALLTIITLRKCRKRRKYLLADIRDVSREVHPSGNKGTPSWLPDHAPTPAEAAALAETVEQLFRAMSARGSAHRRADPHRLHGRRNRRAAGLLGAYRPPRATTGQASTPAIDRGRQYPRGDNLMAEDLAIHSGTRSIPPVACSVSTHFAPPTRAG